MKTNGVKAFPESGLENDATYGRKFYCYINNVRGIKTFVKRMLNRRMRQYNKQLVRNESATA